MAQAKEVKKKTKQPTALKRALQNEKCRLVNRAYRSRVRTTVNDFEESLKKGDVEVVKERLSAVYSLMDKGVKRGVFQANKAARTKSRFTARALAVTTR